MKKFTLILLGMILGSTFVMAGGLVHNTNQSAAWSRMLSRGATLDIDAVYYNPAGLTKLKDGFHISVSSQSIFQTQTINSTFPHLLYGGEFEGKIAAPVFPSAYFAYKTGKWAFSAAFIAIGGGGGAKFDKGVPMMHIPIASLVTAFQDFGVTGYSVDMEFQGRSVYWGLQVGASYAITENISVFAGARYIMAKNSYKGHVRDIKLQMADGTEQRADDFMNNAAAQTLAGSQQAQQGAELALTAGNSMTPIITGGGGELTWDQAVAMGVLTDQQSVALQTGLINSGFSEAEVAAMNMATAQQSYFGTSDYLNNLAGELLVQAGQLQGGAALMGDQEGDITQTGAGITPIIGANLSFFDNDLNIGLKYEFETKLELENEVPSFIEDGKTYYKGFIIGMDENGDPVYMFPDGAKTNADIPAMLSVGVDYRIVDPLLISVTYHSYFDKQTQWAKDDNSIDNNFWELGLGLQYDISENFLVSAGFLRANTGVNKAYQSNLSFSLTSNTIGLGGAYKINDMFKVNFGGYYVMYDKQTYDYQYEVMGNPPTLVNYQDSYLKSTFAVAVGLDIAIGKK